jgi:pyridoxamine 5'-phosphate oxidase
MLPADFPPLEEASAPPTPFPLFDDWVRAAVEHALPEPYAMTLATALPDGTPSARMVLLRGYDERGFLFYTNYTSRKAGDLAVNPRAALLFYWAPFNRQIRIEGEVEKATREESDDYFRSRPVGHRLGALASPQSRLLVDREELTRRMAQLEEEYAGREVPRPPWWGGYRVRPSSIEFWQAQLNRLHDRLRYRREGEGWRLERLAP